MIEKMYIPKTMLVGYQNRDDTMTGKLSYITYKKGSQIYKKTSWENWCDYNLGLDDIDNKPTDGFLFNKDITHVSYNYYSNGSKHSKMRVFDPRGFDFEITINNLSFIINTCNINNGEIEGKFVYAWDGVELILLPVNSNEYKESVSFSKNENKKISARDLVLGRTYQLKKTEDHVIYIGRHHFRKKVNWKRRTELVSDLSNEFECYENHIHVLQDIFEDKGNQHVFYNETKKCYEGNIQSKLSICLDEECSDSYADLLESFIHSTEHSAIVDFDSDNICFDDLKHNHEEENCYDAYNIAKKTKGNNIFRMKYYFYKNDFQRNDFQINNLSWLDFHKDTQIFFNKNFNHPIKNEPYRQSFYFNEKHIEIRKKAFHSFVDKYQNDRDNFEKAIDEKDTSYFTVDEINFFSMAILVWFLNGLNFNDKDNIVDSILKDNSYLLNETQFRSIFEDENVGFLNVKLENKTTINL